MNKTYSMLEVLFYDTDKVDLKYIADFIDTRCFNFGLNTPLRVAHFLAQVKEEVGSNFKPISENLNYSEEVLAKIFSAFRNNDYANKYGRNSNHKSNQEMIANIAYANKYGNGDINSGDGWRFRGAGCLQVTFKSNYQEVQKRINKYLPLNKVDILNGKDIYSLKGCVLAGAGYWIWKDIYKKADLGIDDFAVDEVTAKINKHTDSYQKRRNHFNDIKHLI